MYLGVFEGTDAGTRLYLGKVYRDQLGLPVVRVSRKSILPEFWGLNSVASRLCELEKKIPLAPGTCSPIPGCTV